MRHGGRRFWPRSRSSGARLDADTLAVLPTHYGGALTDVKRVRAIAMAIAPDVKIVEDAAQAFGATWQGRSAGLVGDIGLFSFGAGKGFTLYAGGGLVAREATIMAGLRTVAAELTSNSRLGKARRVLSLIGYHAFYNPLGRRAVYGARKRFWLSQGNEIRAAHDEIPRTVAVHRVGAWRKAVGRAALRRLPAHLANSRERFARLAERSIEPIADLLRLALLAILPETPLASLSDKARAGDQTAAPEACHRDIPCR